MPFAFLSYRREDSREWTTLIFEGLRVVLGPDAVFMDQDQIRSGDNWPRRIDDALERATVLLPIIGQRWLFAQDAAGRRRIDGADDWVRREIEAALTSDKHVLPLLVHGATVPAPDALPDSLKPLTTRQFTRIEGRTDVERLVSDLVARFGFVRLRADLDFPTPVDRSPALSVEELRRWLERHPSWRRIERPLDRGLDHISQELICVFKFSSFDDAIHFMTTAARFVSRSRHHPLWENQYKDVRVSLSTWDTGHRVSYKDTRLAEYLEQLYREYALE
jgi:pterin-4a-carbinolamine dehydratase